MKKTISTAETAKLIRKELKAQFPGTKFSVRSKSYSGGSSINVTWTDGPAEDMVQEITAKYEGASYDGMYDLKTANDNPYLVDFIFTQRKIDVDTQMEIAESFAEALDYQFPGILEEHCEVFNDTSKTWAWVVRELAGKHDLTQWYRVVVKPSGTGFPDRYAIV